MKTLKTLTIIFAVFTASLAFGQQKESNENSTTMRTYLIERDIPGAGKFTQADLQGASEKSCNVIKEMGPGIEWLNSYVLDDKIYCVYKAQSKDLIKEHAEKNGLPCNNIMEIKSNIGPFTADGKVF